MNEQVKKLEMEFKEANLAYKEAKLDSREAELDLREKELILKEIELKLKEITIKTKEEKNSKIQKIKEKNLADKCLDKLRNCDWDKVVAKQKTKGGC